MPNIPGRQRAGLPDVARSGAPPAGGATILVTLVALPASAYYTARHRFRGRTALTLTTSKSAIPLTVRLDSFIGQYTVDWQHLFGASLVATIPVLILFALIERRVVGGLTAGSIR